MGHSMGGAKSPHFLIGCDSVTAARFNEWSVFFHAKCQGKLFFRPSRHVIYFSPPPHFADYGMTNTRMVAEGARESDVPRSLCGPTPAVA